MLTPLQVGPHEDEGWPSAPPLPERCVGDLSGPQATCPHTEPHLPGVFKGPGEGTLKFCGVRAVTGLWEGCGEGLGKKLLGDGAGPELQRSQRDCVCGLWARGRAPPCEPGGWGSPARPT